jgi:hypothetical protein
VSLASLLAVGGLFYGITAGGLWEPHEVGVAELSRRIALHLLGGGDLSLPGADNSLPIRADLGRGELPFTSVALGFRLCGLSAWGGRLPLLLWALAGLVALHAALERLWDRATARYAVLILATTPLYFLQARALLGDAVTLAAFTIAWSGLSVACLASDVSPRARVGFSVIGALGLYAGFWCRGPIVSVAVPALSVGLAGVLQRPREPGARWVALGCAVTGTLALALGAPALAVAARTGEYTVLVGSQLVTPAVLPTFESSLGDLAHAACTWSAAAPLGLALLLQRREQARPAHACIDAAALGLGLSLAASAWLSPSVGALVLPGVSCLAVLIAGALRSLESGSLGSPLLGLTMAALAVVIGFDLRESPDKSMTGFGVAGATLPESLQGTAATLWLGGGLLLGVVAVLCLYERDEAGAKILERAEYARVLGALQRAYGGNVVFALLLLEAGLVGFLLLCALGERLGTMPQLDSFGSFSRKLVAFAAIGVPLSPLAVPLAMLLRDVTRWLCRGEVPFVTRAQGVLLAFAALGGAASLGFYPALARQVSPTQACERYRSLRHAKEPLGVLGVQGGAARYQGVPDAESFDDREVAFEWLTAPAAERRFLLLRQSELAELNAQYRALRHASLPILDARSSELLLASSQLRPGEVDENPLRRLVLDTAPAIQHPLHAVLGDQLEVLGYSLRSASGELQSGLTAAQPYELVVYVRVLAPLEDSSWQTFVHIDGFQRRFNVDHQPLDGKYPLRLWRPGDVLVDSTEVRLEPNFSPGPYRLYFGLFSGDRRLRVTEGPEDDDRVFGGTLQVR